MAESLSQCPTTSDHEPEVYPKATDDHKEGDPIEVLPAKVIGPYREVPYKSWTMRVATAVINFYRCRHCKLVYTEMGPPELLDG